MTLINRQTLGLPSTPGFMSSAQDAMAATGLGPSTQQAAAATPSPFSAIYAFGDSLSDAGNISVLSLHTVPAAPYVNGEFSNGPVWVQDLAVNYGLKPPQPSLAGGTDFAFAGAKTGSEPLHAENPADLPSQFVQFAIINPSPQPNALYTLAIGSNDVLDAISAFATNPATAFADITRAVANEASFITDLAGRGARNFLVMNVPDLSKTPFELAHGPAQAQIASGLSAQYDYQLNFAMSNLVTTQNLNIHVLDSYTLLDAGIANPAAFGLTNVTQPLWSGNFQDPSSGTLAATGAAQSGFLFFDGLHPTATGHALVAAAAQASLQPPA